MVKSNPTNFDDRLWLMYPIVVVRVEKYNGALVEDKISSEREDVDLHLVDRR